MKNDFSLSKTNVAISYSGDILVQDLEKGMVNAARLVRRYGTVYWPIVERLQLEIDAIEKRDALLAKLLDGDATPANQASFG